MNCYVVEKALEMLQVRIKYFMDRFAMVSLNNYNYVLLLAEFQVLVLKTCYNVAHLILCHYWILIKQPARV